MGHHLVGLVFPHEFCSPWCSTMMLGDVRWLFGFSMKISCGWIPRGFINLPWIFKFSRNMSYNFPVSPQLSHSKCPSIASIPADCGMRFSVLERHSSSLSTRHCHPQAHEASWPSPWKNSPHNLGRSIANGYFKAKLWGVNEGGGKSPDFMGFHMDLIKPIGIYWVFFILAPRKKAKSWGTKKVG